ncbi:MAG: hypothetical protein WCC57_04825 [Paracoccaceae bacterium]
MTPHPHRLLALGTSLTLLIALTNTAAAQTQPAQTQPEQSQFDCSAFEFSNALPSIEGKDGVFYRTFTDLRMQHPMADDVVQRLGQLAAVMEQNGTTLIFVTLPSKSQGMPGYLPEHAADYGYDQGIVEAVYHDILSRLTTAGVIAPDIMAALQSAKPDERVFFGTDFHWTADGARLAANAIGGAIKAHPGYADLTPSAFETKPTGVKTAFSGMRRSLQNFCVDALPPVESMTYETTKVAAPDTADGALDIFVAQDGGAQVVLLGTSFSDSTVNNFAGFLSQASGLDVINYAITGGNQFGSITSYLTSAEFKEQRPRFLVWETPIYNSLGQFGPAEMEELIAASGDTCTAPLTITKSDGKTLTADLTGLKITPDDALFFDFGAEGARRAKIALQTPDGITRTSVIERSERLRPTGRFYLGLSAFWHPAYSTVTVEFDRPVTDASQITLCPHANGDAS